MPGSFTITLPSLLAITAMWLYINILVLKVTDDGKKYVFFFKCMDGVNSILIHTFLHKSFLYLIYFISLLAYQDYNQLFIHINLIKLCSKLLFLLTVVFVESNISCLVLSVVSFLVLPILSV